MLPVSGKRQCASPMWRLTDRAVRSTFVTACRLATSPTSTSPFLAKATTDGVVRAPSALAMTVGSPPSSTLTTEFVVPRSIPTARAICDAGAVAGTIFLPLLPKFHLLPKSVAVLKSRSAGRVHGSLVPYVGRYSRTR